MTNDLRKKFQPQVKDTGAYWGLNYLTPERMAAYHYQYAEIVRLPSQRVLEIGIGNGLLSYLLRASGREVTTLDYDEALEPDLVASVVNLPCLEASVDVVACFEVLEHLPFDQFERGLQEIRRVTQRYAVIGLPDVRRAFQVHVPFLLQKKLVEIPLWLYSKYPVNDQHYWEVNKKGYELSKIMRTIEANGFRVVKTYRVWEFSYNRLFVLEKRPLI